MVHITFAEGFVFFGAIILGAVIGIAGNYLVQSSYNLMGGHDSRVIQWIVLIFSFIVVASTLGYCLLWFQVLSQQEDSPSVLGNNTCINQNIINSCPVTNITNNYNYTVYEIKIERNSPSLPVSIEELKRLIQKGPAIK